MTRTVGLLNEIGLSWGLDQTGCAETVSKNQRRLCTSPEAAATELHLTYEDSLAVLRPLLGRIVRTDRLIDFIVYRLYGLTEEEVAVAESQDR